MPHLIHESLNNIKNLLQKFKTNTLDIAFKAQEQGPLQFTEQTYFLTESAQGFQQQQRQQQQQQEQQQVQQQHQQQQANNLYIGSLRTLINRDNIESKQFCKDHWMQSMASQPATLRNRRLKELFSLWVGSDENDHAKKIIQHVTPEAAKILIEHASEFRFGISQDYFIEDKNADDLDSRDNLPEGFLISKHLEDDSLILCYDATRTRQTHSNPFSMVLHQHTPQALLENNAFISVLSKNHEEQQALLICFRYALPNESAEL